MFLHLTRVEAFILTIIVLLLAYLFHKIYLDFKYLTFYKAQSKPRRNLLNSFQHKFYKTILFEEALSHPSMKTKEKTEGYDRLEKLGDSILSTIIVKFLYNHPSKLDPGNITKVQQQIVSNKHLAVIAKILEIDKCLKYNLNTQKSNLDKPIADALEALIGALYIDAGERRTEQWVLEVFSKYINTDLNIYFGGRREKSEEVVNYIQKLYQYCKKNKLKLDFKQSDTKNGFTTVFFVSGNMIGKGLGSNKRLSKHRAAKDAYYSIIKEL